MLVAAAAAAPATTTAPSARRSSRRKASIDAQPEPPQPPVPKKATRQSKRLSGDAITEEVQLNGTVRKKSRARPKASRISEEAVKSPQQPAPPVESAKIALPMSDTPIINRNKEMRRKGNSSRRSSLGSRGRRASSLIESGQTATPHREVDAAEFYKHIEAEGLPEPRRMKQLLMWCGERALAAKPPHGTPNSNAILGGMWRRPPEGGYKANKSGSSGDTRPITSGFCVSIRVFKLVQQRRRGAGAQDRRPETKPAQR